MKILLLSNFYPPLVRGGAELVAQRITQVLCRRGHEVVVLSTQGYAGPASFQAHMTEQGAERVYRFYPANIYHLSHAARYPFPIRLLWHVIDAWSPWSAQVVARVLQEEQPDVVLTHNIKGMGLQVARAIRASGIPWIHTLHDVQLSVPSGLLIWGQEQNFLNRSFLRRMLERVIQQALGSPQIILSPSTFLAEFYRTRGFFPKSRLAILPNPAPEVQLEPRPAPFTGGPIRLLFVGQLEEHKGIRVLLEALDRSAVSWELHVAGEGTLAPFISERAHADSRVTYHGFISLKHLVRLLTSIDAVVLPSVCYENSPTVIYEAFEVGVPVIASRIGGIPELIQEGMNGLLVTPGNVSELTTAILRFSEQRETFRARAEDIRQNAKQYALTAYVDRLESLFPTQRSIS